LHPIWTREEQLAVRPTHRPPKELHEKLAHAAIQVIRLGFDYGSGYAFGKLTESKLVRRVIFLETVAGIPGMVGASLRHLRSLRRIKRDMGWISTLLQEAENERRHMLLFSELKNPSPLFRAMVLCAQGVFWNGFFISYLISPRFCHSFVGYLEEEAVRTYTHAIDSIESGELPSWQTKPAPDSAIRYWRMAPDATMLDVLYNVRADEAWHADTNHTLSDLKVDDMNPHAGKMHGR
jgi:threonyl-tRNA synthetase